MGRRYGWGIHHDQDGLVALVPVGSRDYDALAGDESLRHVKGMPSRLARVMVVSFTGPPWLSIRSATLAYYVFGALWFTPLFG